MAPDFVVIGAAKAGTTSLFRYLRQNPALFAPARKEPRYFAYPEEGPSLRTADPFRPKVVGSWADYQALFADAPERALCFESSVCYLPSPVAAANLRRRVPEVRLIAVLRDPAARAYSHHQFFLSEGTEHHSDFWRCVELEETRARENWYESFGYVRAGFYARHLARYFEHFPREQVLILFSEDLQRDPAGTLARVFDFVGVPPARNLDTATRHNETRIPRLRLLHRLMKSESGFRSLVRKWLPLKLRSSLRAGLERANQGGYVMPPETRARLVEIYRADILELQHLTGRDLSHWLR